MFFDYTDGDFCFGSDNTFFDSDGDMMERLSDTTALDLETGEIHFGCFENDSNDDDDW